MKEVAQELQERGDSIEKKIPDTTVTPEELKGVKVWSTSLFALKPHFTAGPKVQLSETTMREISRAWRRGR